MSMPSGALCFPKSVRLLSSDDYVRVLRHPDINISTGPLRLRAIKNKMPTARVGIVVTKKGNSLAVRRNRIKRLLREQLRHRLADLPELDIVVQVFAAVEDPRLCREINEMLDKLNERFG